MSLEELYRQVILDHYRNPRNKTPLEQPSASAEGLNPLCGDEVTVELGFDGDGHVVDISVRGQGCSISQSSGSMMGAAIKGKGREEIAVIIARFKEMMTSEREDLIDPDHPGSKLGELEALYGVRRYPVRIKCANLPWTTLEQALAG